MITPDDVLEIEVNLNINETYTYDLGNIPSEGGYSIHKQARNFAESEIQINSNASFLVQYIYKPTNNFEGYDSVELLNCISAGGKGCIQTQLIKLNFHIQN